MTTVTFGQDLDKALAKTNENDAVEATQNVFREIAGDDSLDDVVERAVKQIWEKDKENRPFAFYNTFFKGKVLGLSNKEREFFDKKIEGSRDAVIEALNGLGVELKNMSTENIKKSIEPIQTNMTSIDERVTTNTTAHANLKTEYDSFKKTTNEFKDNINPRMDKAETELKNQAKLIQVYHDLAFSNAEELETIVGRIDQSENKLMAYINDENAKLRKLHSEQDGNLINIINHNADIQKSLRNDFDEFTTEFNDTIKPDIGKAIEMISQEVENATQRNLTTNTAQSLKIEELSATIDQLKGQFDPNNVPPKIAELEAEIQALEKNQQENNKKFTAADTNFKNLRTNLTEINEANKVEIEQNRTDVVNLTEKQASDAKKIGEWTKYSMINRKNLQERKNEIENLEATQQQYNTNQSAIIASVNKLTELVKKQASFINDDLNDKYKKFQEKQTTNFVDFVEFAVRRRDLVMRMKEAIYNIDSKTLKDLIVREGDTLYKRNYWELLETFETKRNDVFSTIGLTAETTQSIREIDELLSEKYSDMPADPITVS